jgi:CheY-like chemotaxis protein
MGKILVIDDDAGFCRMAEMILLRAGHEAVLAEDGNRGIACFKIHQPDLVVCDIIMPHKEGIETVRELRAMAPSIPIIAISGGTTGMGFKYLEMARKFGATSTLSKPFYPGELVRIVQDLLGPLRARNETERRVSG